MLLLDVTVIISCIFASAFGLYLVAFRRGLRIKGILLTIGSVFALAFWAIFSQNQTAVKEGWHSASDKLDAEKSGITDPSQWHEKQAALESAKKAETAAADAENRRKGFHCLSPWDGSNEDAIRLLKKSLRDPDSFQHIETMISPVDSEGNHAMSIQYRAKNGFGGMNVSIAIFIVRSHDCRPTMLSVE